MIDYTKALKKILLKRKDRKIILISEGVLGTFLMQTFKRLKIGVNRYIDVRDNGVENFFLPKELQHKSDEYFIIVTIYSGQKRIAEELINMGYRYNVDCTVSNACVYADEVDMVDPLIGYSRERDVCSGIVAYGNLTKEDNLIILILGNSTSDSSTGGMDCWSYYLYTKLSKMCKQNIVVYNGGFSGYYSGQEFLKLCRDGLSLNPSIVISLSGVTEIKGVGTAANGIKLMHKYQWRMWQNILNCPGAIPDSLHMRNLKKISVGAEETLRDSEVWINNERKMYAICKEYGIHFIGCLQPMIARGCVLDNEIKMLLDDMGINNDYYDAQIKFIDEVTREINKYEYLKDLTMLFDGRDNMYYDSMHYSELGNQLVADAMIRFIVNELEI